MNQPHILVTGGAGYIGSHVVKQLGDAGEPLVVLDNLATGNADAVLYGELIEGNTNDQALVASIIKKYNVDAVMHFAASTIVPDSVADPLSYYQNNTMATCNLLQTCQKNGVKHIIFSSTAAVYGMPEQPICDENTPTMPINPYGASKLMSEMMIRDVDKICEMTHVILRYFNVAGSDPQGRVGQRTKKATLLTKVAAEVAMGKRDHLSVFGTDYDTPDGTGVRDYIHVEDLASAHIDALKYLRQQGASTTLNCGYGKGYSVQEIISAFNKQIEQPLAVKLEPRRAGDPPMLVAKADLIQETLGWTPKHNDIDFIVKTVLDWEAKLNAHD